MATRRSPLGNLAHFLGSNEYIRALVVVGFTLAIGLGIRPLAQPIDVAMLFLLAVVLVAARYGRGPALLAVASSIAVFDFCFVPPYYTFAVLDEAYLFTFGVMSVVALIMSGLTGTIRAQALAARRREQRASALFELLRELAGTETVERQLEAIGRHVGAVVGGEAVVVPLPDAAPGPDGPLWPKIPELDDIDRRVAATWAYGHRQSAGWGTVHCGSAEALVVPMVLQEQPFGVVIVTPAEPDRDLEPHELATIEDLVHQAAIILQRAPAAGRVGA